jgi:hypothetical protein
MAWLRLDDKFAQHPKVSGLSDRAFRVHVETMVYCAAYGTKGRIPAAALKLAGATKKQTQELVNAGLWDENGVGLIVHDFEIYNGTTPVDRVESYLAEHPDATANEVYKAVGGNRTSVLAAFREVKNDLSF